MTEDQTEFIKSIIYSNTTDMVYDIVDIQLSNLPDNDLSEKRLFFHAGLKYGLEIACCSSFFNKGNSDV